MGYYNMAEGDEPVLRYLADHYAMSDNFHQAVQGGTGANHIALGTGYAAYYQDATGQATTPPASQIENPDPKPGTNNNYTQDGYSGGSYSDCADHSQPGVSAIASFFASLPYHPLDQCQPGHYYLLNNYNPGYHVDGTVNTAPFTVPPQHDWPTIADQLSARNISWGYFGQGYNNGHPTAAYCGICDPFQYSTSVMTNPAERANTQHDQTDFDASVADGSLPAVSFLKPGDDDGHPGYSTMAAFEQFVAHTVDEVQNQPKLWKDTAILVTMDEGGGYYDSGYVQPVTFFGDGPRIPMIVVSPFTRPGRIDHTYADHVSILKFIEDNWRLHPVSSISEDNLPNPTGGYVPTNRPAIGDLMGLFDFSHAQAAVPPPAAANAHATGTAAEPTNAHR
jgi:phospholipase C